ncbi:MAG: hypothetical protein JWN16_140 [Alphaproteobacteria bacterium]|nr:hypothetical protein [Alphaproteobacteria bacterium]
MDSPSPRTCAKRLMQKDVGKTCPRRMPRRRKTVFGQVIDAVVLISAAHRFHDPILPRAASREQVDMSRRVRSC